MLCKVTHMHVIKCTRLSPSLVEHENQASWWALISFVLIQFTELLGMKPLSYQSCNNKQVQDNFVTKQFENTRKS